MTGPVQSWLDAFAQGLSQGAAGAVEQMFTPDGIWRDYVAFDWTLATYEGRDAIAGFAARAQQTASLETPVFEGPAEAREGFFRFQTTRHSGDGKADGANAGTGRGHICLADDGCTQLFTMLDALEGDQAPPQGATPSSGTDTDAPYVLIVGGGQGGLALGAQLAQLGLPYLIIDRYPRVGDQWRSRYASLVLHDPVWYDHLPFLPFPEGWPVFTPKDQMGDWLEHYASELSLNIQTETEFEGAQYDAAAGCWTANLSHRGESQVLRPSHVVMALGISGFPRVPAFEGKALFDGRQMHSSAYAGGAEFAGQNVVVVGANNSAHDIASDLVSHGARPVMIQRSSTLVVRQQDYCEQVLGALYSAQAVASGLTTDKADILQAAMPIRRLERSHKKIWDRIRADNADYYGRLEAAGFALDFAEDGTGLGMKYRRTASGYYIDVGAAEMVADGRIALRSGVTVDRLDAQSVTLDTGEVLPADAVVYATGYGTMTDWVAALIGPETAERVGPCWGYGSGTRGDPGPWIGELRNMWMPTAQPGLWFTGGNLAQARFYSRRLALQLKGHFLGLVS